MCSFRATCQLGSLYRVVMTRYPRKEGNKKGGSQMYKWFLSVCLFLICCCSIGQCYIPDVFVPTSPSPFFEVLIPSVMIFDDGAFGRKLGYEGGGQGLMEWLPLCKETPESLVSFCLYTCITKKPCEHTEVAFCKPGKRFSPEFEHAGTLILDFQCPEV